MTFTCETCCYPSMRSLTACDNPGCVANPSVSAKQKSEWQSAIDRRNAEDAERERIRGIRRRFA